MPVSQSTSDLSLSLEIPPPRRRHGPVSDFLTLTKARLSSLVVVTTFVGACMAATGPHRAGCACFTRSSAPRSPPPPPPC